MLPAAGCGMLRAMAGHRAFNGLTTREFHRKHGFPPSARCAMCGNRPVMRCIILAPMDEAVRRGMMPPAVFDLDGQMTAEIGKCLVTLKGTDGRPVPFVRLSLAYACEHHKSEMQKAAAKAPSWCVAEISEGPDATDRVQVAC